MRRLHWHSFRDHRRKKWNVWLSSHHWCQWLIDENGERCEGRTCWGPNDVYLEVGLRKRALVEVLNHEKFHCFLGDTPSLRDIEEDIVHRLSEHVYGELARLGMKFPALPPGYEAMVRAARRLERKISTLLADEEEAA